MVYLWALQNSLCGKWWKKFQEIVSHLTLLSNAGYQCNNWVWMFTAVVVLRAGEQQETSFFWVYIFSCDMSGFVIQVLRTLSHWEQKQPENCSPEGVQFFFVFFFLKRGKLNYKHTNILLTCTFSPLIVTEYKRTMGEFVTSCMHLHIAPVRLEYKLGGFFHLT